MQQLKNNNVDLFDMFKDRIFNISLLFSIFWHLFWISLVEIVIPPDVQSSASFQEIEFLGPILEKTAFDILVEQISPQIETLYATGAISFSDEIYLETHGPGRIVLGELLPMDIFKRFGFESKVSVEEKEVPHYLAEEKDIIYTGYSAFRNADFIIEGPASGREIMYRPEQISVSKFIYEADEYIVKLGIKISDDGMVLKAEPIISSGYPEIDLRAMRYIKRWRFAPLSLVKKEKDMNWAVVTLRVKAK